MGTIKTVTFFLLLCMTLFAGQAYASSFDIWAWQIRTVEKTDDLVSGTTSFGNADFEDMIVDDHQYQLRAGALADDGVVGPGSGQIAKVTESRAYANFKLAEWNEYVNDFGIDVADINSITLSFSETSADSPDLVFSETAGVPGALYASSAEELFNRELGLHMHAGVITPTVYKDNAFELDVTAAFLDNLSGGAWAEFAVRDASPSLYSDFAFFDVPLLRVTYGEGGGTGTPPVPEPGTMVMLGLGIAGYLGLRKKATK